MLQPYQCCKQTWQAWSVKIQVDSLYIIIISVNDKLYPGRNVCVGEKFYFISKSSERGLLLEVLKDK